ncbi:TetR/AcrR family transcriptional regulator [Microbacterium fluvii]|uniref:TetR/AcrR family transcriptional regulator n=1 Tax=Microbacterium fluvii TaxID=415215 RepID=A0ABW2HCL5_9MICO|nr:TetR/AcrR family transcriptional regulator C-terminal domain-containing protein [Microbacterium fluvii]MCU4671812.1 TetR/AcrR family transcriptional regulator C-terminal domain-containing protein [Microbacterium fluvii]
MTVTPPRRPGRPPIPRERIIEAALEFVDEHGGDALTLRALATQMSSGTATLYRNVSGRAELIGLVVDRMLAEVPDVGEDEDTGRSWDEVCREVLTGAFLALTRHRRAASLLADTFPDGPAAFALRERLTRALLRADFPVETAASSVATLARYTLGIAMQSDNDQPSPEALIALEGGRYPYLAKITGRLPELHEEFEFGLALMLRGLEATRRSS